MTLSFLKIFKRKAIQEQMAPPPARPPVEKSAADRLSKTVLPNQIRAAAPDAFTLPQNGSATPAAARVVSMGGSVPQVSAGLPPAVALALEPKVERVIPLHLGDVVAQMPPGFVRPLEDANAGRTVLLKAAELERGMANGRPSVSIATIYQQVPEIFLQPITPNDETQVELPFAKVMEQFTRLQLRGDQVANQPVPQVETPFLKVTLEDGSKFGTSAGPVQTEPPPSISALHEDVSSIATADSLAAAEPETAVHEKVVLPTPPPMPSISLHRNGNGAANGNGNGHAAPAPAPTRIPFNFTPNGAGASAGERVPASASGASVPTSLPPPAPGPTRVSFKLKPTDDEAPAKMEPWLTKANPEGTENAPAPTPLMPKAETKISLPLKPILNALPPFQLTGDLSKVAEDARIELPFALVEAQLASGRVSITPNDFSTHLPEPYRGLFSAREIDSPVALPLHEVLKNLPVAALRMRDDQVEPERGADFATPFSATAEEDARRLNVASTAVARPVPGAAASAPAAVAPVAESAQVEIPKMVTVAPRVTLPTEAIRPSPGAGRNGLQEIFETDDELDAKSVAARVEQMTGVSACALMFGDGLKLAGALPASYAAEGLCAMAPTLMQRVENHIVETKLGLLRAMTLACTHGTISFFMHGNLCLAALHAPGEFPLEVCERLGRVVQELSRTYSHPV